MKSDDKRNDQPCNKETFDFERAVETIRTAAEVLAKPEAKTTLTAIQDAAKAVAGIQDAMKAVAVQDTMKAVAVQDAMKAVAVQDAMKAVAVQDAMKAVAVQGTSNLSSIINISEDIARALKLIRESASIFSSKEPKK